MAFNFQGLNRVVGALSADLWFYATSETVSDVTAAGYFNGASDMLAKGDVIIVADSSTPATATLVVSSSKDGVVQVSAPASPVVVE